MGSMGLDYFAFKEPCNFWAALMMSSTHSLK